MPLPCAADLCDCYALLLHSMPLRRWTSPLLINAARTPPLPGLAIPSPCPVTLRQGFAITVLPFLRLSMLILCCACPRKTELCRRRDSRILCHAERLCALPSHCSLSRSTANRHLANPSPSRTTLRLALAILRFSDALLSISSPRLLRATPHYAIAPRLSAIAMVC